MGSRDDTTAIIRKTPTVSPDMTLKIKAGVLVTIIGSAVLAGVWLWQIKANSEQALAELRDVRCAIEPLRRDVDRLKWDHERRSSDSISRAVFVPPGDAP